MAVLEAELAFYGLIFGFATPEVPPLKLEGHGVKRSPRSART